MAKRVNLNRIPVSHIKPPAAPVEVEKVPLYPPDTYGHLSTITLQSTLVSLRVTTTMHGHTERTRKIEADITDELESRGETP